MLTLALLLSAAGAQAQADDPWLGRDKLLHFSLSVGISGASYAASLPLFDAPWQRALFAAGVTLGLGAGKELYDATGHGDASWRDFTWDVLGCALGVGVALVLDLALWEPARAGPLVLRF